MKMNNRCWKYRYLIDTINQTNFLNKNWQKLIKISISIYRCKTSMKFLKFWFGQSGEGTHTHTLTHTHTTKKNKQTWSTNQGSRAPMWGRADSPHWSGSLGSADRIFLEEGRENSGQCLGSPVRVRVEPKHLPQFVFFFWWVCAFFGGASRFCN